MFFVVFYKYITIKKGDVGMSVLSKRKTKRKAHWPLRILVIAGVAFLFIQIWRTQDQLNKTQQENQGIQESIQKQTVYNEDLAAQMEDKDAILERKANEAGFYLPGQQIYMETAG